ncbi:hypothetical protein CRE_14681 [Caenorhabditis remanei]|uniref:F-box associated domain-containing protein n=1 Tax=Caenorhabditis remanei TaxID=31234 RepID=E3M9J3_CAERE|nr:hypothetical protein CRE_14681 [Caenorhabditis remanei]
MTYNLSYPGQRCIIEFLEANKRIHLVSRSPALQKAEKSIPFNLDHVQITPFSLTLNNICIQIYPATEQIPEDDARYERRPAEVRMQPGFIRSGHSDSVWHRKFNEVVFMRNRERIASRPIPENVKDYIALEKLNQIITNREDFKYYLPLIDSSSFPLKKLKIPFLGSEIFEHPIVQNSDCLTIDELSLINDTIPLNDIRNLTNKTVVIQHSKMRIEEMMTLIRDWLRGEKSIGTTLMLEKSFMPINQAIFRSIKETFKEFENDLEHVEENFLLNCPRFCIPINNMSNLLVYGISRGIVNNNINWPVSAFVMKVVATTPEVMPGNCQFEDGAPLILPSMIFVLFAFSYFCGPSTSP